MADQDYPHLYEEMEASAQRTREAAISFEHILGGPEADMVPVNGYPAQPTIAGRVGDYLDSFAGSQEERAEAFATAQQQFAEAFDEFLKSSGFETPVDYVAGISIVRPTQTVRYNNELYRAKDASLPFTTTNWATDAAKLLAVGDFALRQSLASPSVGGKIVGLTTGETMAQRVANTVRSKTETSEIDIIIGYGQSNMRGYAAASPGAPSYSTENVTLWNGSAEIPLTSYTPTQNDGVSTGSLFAAFGNEFAARTGRRAIMANCGRGSQSMASLSKGAANTNYSGLVNWVSAIKDYITGTGHAVGKISILWCQGEADSVAGTTTTSSSYYASLAALWTDLQADTGATSLGIFTVGFYADNSKLNGQGIQSAQRRFAADTANAFIVFDDMESMGALGMKVDSVHLNQYGYNYIGKKGAESFCDAVYLDGHTEADRLADRLGVIALDGSQAWGFFGGWFNKAATGTAWNLSTLGSRALTGVIKVEEVDTYTLRVTLADRIDYILRESASCFLAINATREPIKAMVLPNTYQNVDAAGNTCVDIRFFADVTYLMDLAAQTLAPQTTDGLSAALGNALITSVNWGTGGATITHVAGGVVPLVTPSSDAFLPTFANVVGATPMNVRLFDLAGAPVNRKAWLMFKGAAVPLAALGLAEIRLEVIGCKRRSS